MRHLTQSSILEWHEAITSGERSALEVIDAHLERIDARDDELNAFTTVIETAARERAREADRAVEQGDDLGPLHGIPIALKDLYAFKAGVRNTFGSKLFADYIPEENAILVDRLEAAGAIVIGKTNTPEFGRKATTDNPLFGATGNPFEPSKTAGGSSGGSAAAVASGMAAAAQGSDAAGSIRIPASACGVYGFKPSAGRVPQASRPNGYLGQTPHIDRGPITRTVADAALLLEVMAGPHPRDPLSVPADDTAYLAATDRSITDARIAASPDLGIAPVDERVRAVFDDAIDAFRETGATVERIDAPLESDWTQLHDAFAIELQGLYAAMARTFDAEYDIDLVGADRTEATPEVVERVETGLELSAAEYRHADVVRTQLFDDLQDLFETYDYLLTPTLTVPPFDKDQTGPESVAGTPIDPEHGWLLTWPFNMTGHPAASLPGGMTADGLPVGIQLVGRRYDDASVLAASAAFERVSPWHDTYLSL